MIIPNLVVADIDRSIAFYRDLLGMTVTMSVDADQGYSPNELRENSVFAGLECNGLKVGIGCLQPLRIGQHCLCELFCLMQMGAGE